MNFKKWMELESIQKMYSKSTYHTISKYLSFQSMRLKGK